MNSLTFCWATQTSITVKNAYNFLQVYSEEFPIRLCIRNEFKPQALKTLISKIDQKSYVIKSLMLYCVCRLVHYKKLCVYNHLLMEQQKIKISNDLSGLNELTGTKFSGENKKWRE